MRNVILAVALLAGCSNKDEGPSCTQVTDHLFELVKVAYPGHGDMGMGDKKSEIATCEKRGLSATERRCLLAAQDMTAVAKCRAPSK